MEGEFKKVLIKGDEVPKVNIICDVLPEGLRARFRDFHIREKKNVLLYHCDFHSHIENEESIKICSVFVPYGVVIYIYFFEKDERKIISDMDEIVYMEPYPFTLGEKIRADLDDMSSLLKQNYNKHFKIQFKILFYRDIHQKTGAGENIGIDQVLEDAPKRINELGKQNRLLSEIEYCVYRFPKDLINIVHGGFGSLSIVMETCSERFRKYKNAIDPEIFFSEYGEYNDVLEWNEKYESLRRLEAINRITKFREVEGSNDVVRTYAQKYISAFQDLLLELVEEVYISLIKDVCFWNLDKDISNLKTRAKKLIEGSLLSISEVKVSCPQHESEYNKKIRNELKLDVLFEEKVECLVNREMKEYLYGYLLRKEELLSKTFDN